jgi:hypothetical protein
MTFNR